jgi:hypothetical protein
MIIKILDTPLTIVHYWPKLKTGFDWMTEHTKFKYHPETTLETLCFLSGLPGKSYIAVALENDEVLGFIVVFDSTPLFEQERVFNIYAIWHKPSQIKTTRKLLNNFELWAVSQGVTRYSLATRKYGKNNLSLFSKLGFSRDCLILSKEI